MILKSRLPYSKAVQVVEEFNQKGVEAYVRHANTIAVYPAQHQTRIVADIIIKYEDDLTVMK